MQTALLRWRLGNAPPEHPGARRSAAPPGYPRWRHNKRLEGQWGLDDTVIFLSLALKQEACDRRILKEHAGLVR